MSRRTPKPSNVTPITTRQGVIQHTGEVVSVEFPAQRGRRRRGRRKVYAMVDLESLNQLQLSGSEWRVLTRVMRSVNPETNEARVTVTEVASDCGMARPNASRVIRRLRDRRIIYTEAQGVHRVNPHIMFRGSNLDWDVATETAKEPIWRRAS